MLGNLKLREGGKVSFTTVKDLPKGQLIKLQPHTNALVELAAAIGPRELLEEALRKYSALSNGERIMLDVAGERHFMDIVDVKPGKAISIYGDLDLEVDFAPVKGSPEDIAEAQAKAASTGNAKDKAIAEQKQKQAEIDEAKATAAAALRIKQSLMEGSNGSSSSSSSSSTATSNIPKSPTSPSTPGRMKSVTTTVPPNKQSPSTTVKSPNLISQLNKQGNHGSPTRSGAKGLVSPKSNGKGAVPNSTVGTDDTNIDMSQYSMIPLAEFGITSTATTAASVPSTNTHHHNPGHGHDPKANDMFAPPLHAPTHLNSSHTVVSNATTTTGGSIDDNTSSFAGTGNRLGSKASPMKSPSRNNHQMVPNTVTASTNVLGGMKSAAELQAERRQMAAEREARILAAMARQQAMTDVTNSNVVSTTTTTTVISSTTTTVTNNNPTTATTTSPIRTSVQSGWLSSSSASSSSASPGSRKNYSVSESKLQDTIESKEDISPQIISSSTFSQPTNIYRSRFSHESKEGDNDYEEETDDGISPMRKCKFCLTEVPRASYDLHSSRCRRNTAYHKTTCKECNVSLFIKDAARHLHCPSCHEVLIEMATEGITPEAALLVHQQACAKRLTKCECGATMTADTLTAHRDACPSARESCRYCKVLQRRSLLVNHEDRCGSRTSTCENGCGKLIVLKNMANHILTCPGATVVTESKLADDDDNNVPTTTTATSKSKNGSKYDSKLPDSDNESLPNDDIDDGDEESKQNDGTLNRIQASKQTYTGKTGNVKPTTGGIKIKSRTTVIPSTASAKTSTPAVKDPEMDAAIKESLKYAQRMETAKAAQAEIDPGIQEALVNSLKSHDFENALVTAQQEIDERETLKAATNSLKSSMIKSGIKETSTTTTGRTSLGGTSSTTKAGTNTTTGKPPSRGNPSTVSNNTAGLGVTGKASLSAAAVDAARSSASSARNVATTKASTNPSSATTGTTNRPPSGSGAAAVRGMVKKTTTTESSSNNSGSGISRRSENFPCPHCSKGCKDYEALQMHVFTACKAASNNGGSFDMG